MYLCYISNGGGITKLFSVLSQTGHVHQMQHAALLLLCGGWMTCCSFCIQTNRENARSQRARRTSFVLKQAFIIVLNVKLPFWQCIRRSLLRLHIVCGSRILATATEGQILLEQVSGPDQLPIYIRQLMYLDFFFIAQEILSAQAARRNPGWASCQLLLSGFVFTQERQVRSKGTWNNLYSLLYA